MSGMGSKEGRYVKVKIDKPLFRGTKIKLEGINRWIEFNYEQFSMVCFCCGILGHNANL